MGGLIKPDELKHITEDIENTKAREALEKKRKADHERDEFHDSFMARDIHPDVFDRLSRLVKTAAEHGQHEVLVMQFPSSYCTDRGRAINNFEPDWPQTLTGFAKKAMEFYEKELEPAGYKVRAQILDYPGGMPGDVGIFLRW
jgi:hypothetical protein